MKPAILALVCVLASAPVAASPHVDLERAAQLRDALADGLDPTQRHPTANDLHDAAEAFGYVQGIASYLAREKKACYPQGLSREQKASTVMAYMSTHTDQWAFPASGLVADALVNAYPCQGGELR